MTDRLLRSESLHERARAFIHGSVAGAPTEPFDALAIDLARFQAEHVPAIDKLRHARGVDFDRVTNADAIPAVPADAFKLARLACHDPELDAVVFRTSGTTAGSRGEHPLRVTATYELSARSWGAACLFGDGVRPRALLLAPPPAETPDSSLGFMLKLFARAFCCDATWVVSTRGASPIDVETFVDVCTKAKRSATPVAVLGPSFAFVHLLERLAGVEVPLPRGSRIMQTGGFKGRSREVEPDTLRARMAAAFDLPTSSIVGEYGMTELSSQAYQTTFADSVRVTTSDAPRLWDSPAGDGDGNRYVPPAWMRVEAVDPATLVPVGRGCEGIARITDLANVDSAVCIQTADRVRIVDGGFELLGRMPDATPRGCSLAIEELFREGFSTPERKLGPR